MNYKELKMTTKQQNHKIGRDAKTGEFIAVKEAQRRPNTTVIETIRHSPIFPKKK